MAARSRNPASRTPTVAAAAAASSKMLRKMQWLESKNHLPVVAAVEDLQRKAVAVRRTAPTVLAEVVQIL